MDAPAETVSSTTSKIEKVNPPEKVVRKRKFTWTPKRKEAFQKCVEANRKRKSSSANNVVTSTPETKTIPQQEEEEDEEGEEEIKQTKKPPHKVKHAKKKSQTKQKIDKFVSNSESESESEGESVSSDSSASASASVSSESSDSSVEIKQIVVKKNKKPKTKVYKASKSKSKSKSKLKKSSSTAQVLHTLHKIKKMVKKQSRGKPSMSTQEEVHYSQNNSPYEYQDDNEDDSYRFPSFQFI